VHHATRDGKAVELQIQHFSGGGAGNVQEADFANIVGPILNQSGPLSFDQIRSLLAVRGEFEALFDRLPPPEPGYSFCANQPLCEQVTLKALAFLKTKIDEACAAGRANPELTALAQLRTLLDLEAQRTEFGATAPISTACQRDIMASLIGQGTVVARAVPFDPPLLGLSIPNDVLGDLDGVSPTTNFEFLFRLAGNATQLGFEDLGRTGSDNALTILRELPGRGRTRCESNAVGLAGGIADLQIGRRWSEIIDPDGIRAFLDALDFCRLEVSVSPSQSTVLVGTQRQFTANVAQLIDPPRNAEVTWSATAGSIDANGNYTAPNTPGTYQVTAKSVLNPARSATVDVTVVSPGAVTIDSGGGGGEGHVNVACSSGPGASGDDIESQTTPSFSPAPWFVTRNIGCPGFGGQDSSSTGSAQQSASAFGSLSVTGSGQGSLGGGGNQAGNVSSGSARSNLQFTINGGPLNVTLEGTISRGTCPQASGPGVKLGAFESNGGEFSHSGTLQPGQHTFSIEVGAVLPFPDNEGGVNCSYSYSFSLSVTG
jgi:hypothetical protein